MQRKTIEKTIKSKVQDWAMSIDEVKLGMTKDILLDKVIVTGGCISSMFLREQVNDFDIYFRDHDTALKIAHYYAHDSTVLDGHDADELLKTFYVDYPHLKIDNVKKSELNEDFLGVNSHHIALLQLKMDKNRIMYYFNGQYGRPFEYEESNTDKYKVMFLSPNAISLSDDVQLIIRFYGDPATIHDNYDFVHATNYWTMKDGLVTNIDALESLLSKQLYYHGSKYPVTSILRAKKFILRGWKISAGEYLKIMFQISQLNLTDPVILAEQLIGIDMAYFSKIVDILSNTSNKNITSDYINTIIDKVFGDNQSDE